MLRMALCCTFAVAGASISQLTDPFSMTPERIPQDDRSSQSEGEDSDDQEHHSFLITTVDTTTGQSSFSLTEGCDNAVCQEQKTTASGQVQYPAKSLNTFQGRTRTFSDSNQPGMSSSLPRSAQQFSSVAPMDKNPGKNSPTKKEVASNDLKCGGNKRQWSSWRGGKGNEGKTLNNEIVSYVCMQLSVEIG